jgi:hypothetical protein
MHLCCIRAEIWVQGDKRCYDTKYHDTIAVLPNISPCTVPFCDYECVPEHVASQQVISSSMQCIPEEAVDTLRFLVRTATCSRERPTNLAR